MAGPVYIEGAEAGDVLKVKIQKIIPILIDGGIRRGTDIFKALSLGQQGVEIVLDILKAELIPVMQLAGTASMEKISRNHILIN